MSDYTFTLTNGTTLGTVYALEGNGDNAQSTPRQILDIDFSGNQATLIIAGNSIARFTAGLVFSIVGSTPYLGSYKVGSAGSSLDVSGNTRIPLDPTTPLASLAFAIIAVSPTTGGNSTWTISGAYNGNYLFYPSSTFTVSGNSFPGANLTYRTLSAVSSNTSYAITGVSPGVPGAGTWTIAGNQTAFFVPGQHFNVVNNGAAGTYTVSSAAFVGGNTVITAVEQIPNSATIAGTIATAVTVITVNTTGINNPIPVGATATGNVTPPTSQQLEFVAPTAITQINATTYDITWRVAGDFSTILTPGFPIVIKNNSYYTYQNFTVLSATYSAGITSVVTQAVSTANLTSLVSGTYAQAITAVTTGVSGTWSILGNFTALPALAPGKTFVIVGNTGTGNGIYLISSVAYLAGHTVITVNGTVPVGSPPDGTMYISNGFLVFPIPVVPFGFIQYNTPNPLSSLQLVGRGAAMYNNTEPWGQAVQTSQLHMTEHWANTTPPTHPLIGQMWYNTSTGQLNLYSLGSTWSVVSVGLPGAYQAINSNAGAITAGQPVYASTSGHVDMANATTLASSLVIGFVADSSIATGATGNITVFGTFTSANWTAVTGAATLTTGAVYYLSETPGQLTLVAPSVAGHYVAPVGIALSTTTMKLSTQQPIML